MRLRDKVALITGAGSGVGRATALLFSQEGAKVVVADIDEKKGEETVQLIKNAGGEAIPVRADVSKDADVLRMIERTVNVYSQLDILYNNAGFPMVSTPIEKVTEELWYRVVDVNFKGVFLACKHAVPLMKAKGRGVIINTASIGGVRPRPGFSAYHGAKAAVIALTKVVALEVAKYGIRVNCINPVAIDTPMGPQFITESGEKDEKYRETIKGYVAGIPLGRLATAEDIARAALFLASDDAAFLTGINIDVDGGRSI